MSKKIINFAFICRKSLNMTISNTTYRITLLLIQLLAIVPVAVSVPAPAVPAPHALPTRSLMPVANVNAVIQDREGYMWYATYEGGLCRDNGYQIDIFRKDRQHPQLLSDNIIHSLCEAPDGQIWFSTAHCVYVLDKHDYSIRPLSEQFRNISVLHISTVPAASKPGRSGGGRNMQLSADTVTYIVSLSGKILSAIHQKYQGRRVIVEQDRQGGYWICHADKDICYAQGDTSRVIRRHSIQAKNVLFDPYRNCLYAITRQGLQVFAIDNTQQLRSIYTYRDIPEIGVYGLSLDSRHNLWMTGYQPSFTIFTPPTAIQKLNISSPKYDAVYVDHLEMLPDNRLGIFKDINYYAVYDISTGRETLISSDTITPPHLWKSEKLLTLINTMPDVDTLLVKDAAIDARGHLWVVFDQTVREINTRKKRYRDINLPSQYTDMNNFCCIVPLGNGVCVGGAGGVCFMASNLLLDDDGYDVPVGISSYEMTSHSGNVKKLVPYADGDIPSLEVDHNCTCLTLYFTSFNHVYAPNIRFAVKVEGWKGDWVSLAPGENTFRLLNLPKGNYRILLRATDENGLWGKEHGVLDIQRLPAWWESTWAYTLYIILVVAVLLSAFLLYRYVQRKREQFHNMLRLQQTAPEPALVVLPDAPQRDASPASTGSEHVSVPPTPHNSEFRDKAIAAVKANLDNEEYTVDIMADALCMSRVNLYRKMMTECGQTPSEFIKTLRLEHAYHLLSTTSLPVNIIAGKCGFTSSSYFAKCFKARFGVLPSNLATHDGPH